MPTGLIAIAVQAWLGPVCSCDPLCRFCACSCGEGYGSLRKLPASITVVPGQLMKDQAMQSLADVIRYVPGALAHQGEGNRDEFIFRGIGSSANLYVDGIRDDAQVFRDLYNLEQVDVIKGAPGMIFGRGAGGVLNRVTKRPLFDHADEVSFTAGSHGQLRSTADLGGRMSGDVAWRLNAMAEDSNSFREGVGMNQYAVNPTLAWHPNTETSLTLGVELLRDNRTADRGVPSLNGRPIGGRWNMARHLTMSAAVFRLDRDHVRNADGNGGFVQSGQQRTQGMELGLQGEVTPTWHVHAGYAHLDSKITKATASTGTLGHVPQLVPADTFSMWNRIDFTGRVAVGLGLVYQGASYANVDNKDQLPAFARSDAALYYTFEGRRARLALNVENLFDRKYFPTADANNNISVGAPRQARVTLSTVI